MVFCIVVRLIVSRLTDKGSCMQDSHYVQGEYYSDWNQEIEEYGGQLIEIKNKGLPHKQFQLSHEIFDFTFARFSFHFLFLN